MRITNGGRVDSSTGASGSAGSVIVNATDLIEVKGAVPGSLNPSLIISSANIVEPSLQRLLKIPSIPSGSSGDVVVNTNRLIVSEGGLISVKNDGIGDAGNLNIIADSIELNQQGGLSAATVTGKGGNTFLQSQNLLLTNSSNISATAGNNGDGGSITINTDTLVALENSDINANAFEGNGGNIQIFTQGLFSSPDSQISTDSTFGIDGILNVQSLGFEVEDSIVPLANNFISTEQIVAGSCLARRNAVQSSFVVTGSGALPTNPDYDNQEWESLSKPTNITAERSQNLSLNPVIRPWKLGDPIVEAQGIVRLPNGQVLLGEKSGKLNSPESITCKN